MSAELHPDAIAELDSSADWYAERSQTASRNFLVAVDVTIATIVSDPNRFAYIDDRHQSCAVTKFPFQVVFRQVADRILVLRLLMQNVDPVIGPVDSAAGRLTWFLR